ncbi:MAG: hypothetical protein AAFY71_01890 [Bacteroidota bacterium]
MKALTSTIAVAFLFAMTSCTVEDQVLPAKSVEDKGVAKSMAQLETHTALYYANPGQDCGAYFFIEDLNYDMIPIGGELNLPYENGTQFKLTLDMNTYTANYCGTTPGIAVVDFDFGFEQVDELESESMDEEVKRKRIDRAKQEARYTK